MLDATSTADRRGGATGGQDGKADGRGSVAGGGTGRTMGGAVQPMDETERSRDGAADE